MKKIFGILTCLTWLGSATLARAAVYLIELPGASGRELIELSRAGALTAGGFSRFFEQGETASGVVVANPVLPEIGRLELLAGPAGKGEIVQLDGSGAIRSPERERSHLLTDLAKAGRLTGSVLWPGLDGLPPDARPEWGLPERESEEFPARIQEVLRRGWEDERYGVGPGPSRLWSLPPEVKSFSTPLTVGFPFLRPHEWAKFRLDLVAIDRTDDGVENYDGILVSTERDPKKGFVGILEPDRWLEFVLPALGSDGRALPQRARLRVLRFDPRLERTVIYSAPVAFLRPYPGRFLTALGGQQWIWPAQPEAKVLLGEGLARLGLGIDAFAEGTEQYATEALRAAVTGAREFSSDLVLVSLALFDTLDSHAPLPRERERRDPGRERNATLRQETWRALDRALAAFWPRLDFERDRVVLVSTSSNFEATQVVDLWEVWKPVAKGRNLPGTFTFRGATFGLRLQVAGRDAGGKLAPAEAKRILRDLAKALSQVRDGANVVFPRVSARLAGQDGFDLVAHAGPGYLPVESGRTTGILQPLAPPQAIAGVAAEAVPVQGLYLAVGAGVKRGELERAPAVSDLHQRLRTALGLGAAASGKRR